MVFAAEFINTAIEAVVDLASPEKHPLAKVGKDVGAAAVLISAVAAVLIGLLILGPPLWEKLMLFFKYTLVQAAKVAACAMILNGKRGDIMTLSFRFGTVGSPIGTPKKPGGSVGAIPFSNSIGLQRL